MFSHQCKNQIIIISRPSESQDSHGKGGGRTAGAEGQGGVQCDSLLGFGQAIEYEHTAAMTVYLGPAK